MFFAHTSSFGLPDVVEVSQRDREGSTPIRKRPRSVLSGLVRVFDELMNAAIAIPFDSPRRR
jgi:hypothetical protein